MTDYPSLLVDGILACGPLASGSCSDSSIRRNVKGDGSGVDLEMSLGARRACLIRRTPSMMESLAPSDCRRDGLDDDDDNDEDDAGMSASATPCKPLDVPMQYSE